MMYTSGRECINVGKPCSPLLQIKFGNDGNQGGTLLVMTGGTSEE